MISGLTTPALHYEFSVTVELGDPADHGMTRAGHRRVVPITGGAVTGSIEGSVVPGGADWQIVHDDGSIEIDGRYSLHTMSGSLVYLQVHGVRNQIDSDTVYFRTTAHVETSDPAYAYLQRSLIVAACIRDSDRVRYNAYRVT